MNKHITALVSASALALLSVSTSAALFGNPSVAIYPPATPAVLGPLVTTLSSSVVDDNGNFAATLTTAVHSGGSNPLGGLTFVYTLSNDLLPPSNRDDVYAFSVTWNPAWIPAVIDVDTAAGAGVVPFSFGFGPNGVVFAFNFVSLVAGATSVPIAVGTAAPLWTTSNAGIINGTTEDAVALVPVPEPSTFAGLFALGLAGFAAFRRFRC